MKNLCKKFKAFVNSGIKKVAIVCKENKKAIALFIGKFIIDVCKIIIEIFLENHF